MGPHASKLRNARLVERAFFAAAGGLSFLTWFLFTFAAPSGSL